MVRHHASDASRLDLAGRRRPVRSVRRLCSCELVQGRVEQAPHRSRRCRYGGDLQWPAANRRNGIRPGGAAVALANADNHARRRETAPRRSPSLRGKSAGTARQRLSVCDACPRGRGIGVAAYPRAISDVAPIGTSPPQAVACWIRLTRASPERAQIYRWPSHNKKRPPPKEWP